MKTKALFLLIAVYFFSPYAKAQLTNGQVYNFDIGDVFQTEFHHENIQFPYAGFTECITTKNILDKQLSASGDSLFYTIHVTSYVDSGCYVICSQPYGTLVHFYYNYDSTYVQSYTNLDQEVTFPSHPNSYLAVDTIKYNTCNDTMWYKLFYNTYSSSEYEAANWYVMGAGGVYYDIIEDSDHTHWKWNKLIYYKKGSVECGTMYQVGIRSEELLSDRLSLFPNPTNGSQTIKIQSNAQIEQIKIGDCLGKEIKTLKVSDKEIEVDITPYANGVYFVEIISEGGRAIKKVVLNN